MRQNWRRRKKGAGWLRYLLTNYSGFQTTLYARPFLYQVPFSAARRARPGERACGGGLAITNTARLVAAGKVPRVQASAAHLWAVHCKFRTL